MIESEKYTLIQYRLSRAQEALEEADIMFKLSHWNTSVNRLYYACFYAVSALLLQSDLSSSKHSGVRSLFHQHFVKTGQISKKYGKYYNELFEKRQEGDYKDLYIFNPKTVQAWIPQAQQFVQMIMTVIGNVKS